MLPSCQSISEKGFGALFGREGENKREKRMNELGQTFARVGEFLSSRALSHRSTNAFPGSVEHVQRRESWYNERKASISTGAAVILNHVEMTFCYEGFFFPSLDPHVAIFLMYIPLPTTSSLEYCAIQRNICKFDSPQKAMSMIETLLTCFPKLHLVHHVSADPKDGQSCLFYSDK